MGYVIKELRKKNSLTQEELAYGICSVPYLSKVENNKMQPSLVILEPLLNKLGIDKKVYFLMKQREDHLKKSLNHWVEKIENKEVLASKNYNLQFKECNPNSFAITSQHSYLLVLFRYYLLTKHPETENLKARLFQFIDSLTEERLYQFHKYISIYFIQKGDYKNAFCHLKEAQIVHKQLRKNDADFYYIYSMVLARLDKISESIKYALEALNYFEQSLKIRRLMECKIVLAINYIKLKNYDKARQVLTQMLDSNLKIYNKIDLGFIYHNLGYISFKEKHYDTALEHFETALTFKEEEEKKLTTIYLIANIYLLQQKIEKLSKTIRIGKDISNKYENIRYQYKFFVLENIINESLNERKFINKLKQEIIPYFYNMGEVDEYINFLTIYSETLYEGGNYKEASEGFRLVTKFQKGDIS